VGAIPRGRLERARRAVQALPPYLFAALDAKLSAKRAPGCRCDLLGWAIRDLPTPDYIVEAMREAGAIRTHRYPSYLRQPRVPKRRRGLVRAAFGVELDPGSEVMALIGSKEGIGHIALAFVDPATRRSFPIPAIRCTGSRRGWRRHARLAADAAPSEGSSGSDAAPVRIARRRSG